MPIRLEINRQSYSLLADPDTPLLYALRDELGLTGSKYGCGEGQCGACTVLVAARRGVRACFLLGAAGKSVTTIEGLDKDGAFIRSRRRFWKQGRFSALIALRE